MWLSRTPLPRRSSLGVLWPATVLSAVAASRCSSRAASGPNLQLCRNLGRVLWFGGLQKVFHLRSCRRTAPFVSTGHAPTQNVRLSQEQAVQRFIVTNTRAEYGNSSPPSSTLSTRLTSSPIVLCFSAAGSVMFGGRPSLAASRAVLEAIWHRVGRRSVDQVASVAGGHRRRQSTSRRARERARQRVC